MIKLALFMNEPLQAHELYQKEIHSVRMEERSKRKKHVEELEETVKTLRKSLEEKDEHRGKLKEQLRQSKCQLKVYQKKFEG